MIVLRSYRHQSREDLSNYRSRSLTLARSPPLSPSLFLFNALSDCFHTRAKCVIWIIIWIAHFELRSVHTREVIAIFELSSVHAYTRDRIWDFPFQREKNVWVPCQSNMHGARISCASVHMQHAVYRRKWLEGHLAPPPKSRFRGQGIHTVISLRDLRNA